MSHYIKIGDNLYDLRFNLRQKNPTFFKGLFIEGDENNKNLRTVRFIRIFIGKLFKILRIAKAQV